MTVLIVILAIVAIIVVAVVALDVGYANGCKHGYLIGLQEGLQACEEKTPDYENGYMDAAADFNASLINWN